MEETLVTATVIGTVISLFLEWFPGIKQAWHKLDANRKRIYVAVIVLMLNTAAVIASCGGMLAIAECPAGDWRGQILTAFVSGIWAIISSQGVHSVAKQDRPVPAA